MDQKNERKQKQDTQGRSQPENRSSDRTQERETKSGENKKSDKQY